MSQQGIQTFNILYWFRGQQGSIWSVQKGTSLKILCHSVVEWSQAQDWRMGRTIFGWCSLRHLLIYPKGSLPRPGMEDGKSNSRVARAGWLLRAGRPRNPQRIGQRGRPVCLTFPMAAVNPICWVAVPMNTPCTCFKCVDDFLTSRYKVSSWTLTVPSFRKTGWEFDFLHSWIGNPWGSEIKAEVSGHWL